MKIEIRETDVAFTNDDGSVVAYEFNKGTDRAELKNDIVSLVQGRCCDLESNLDAITYMGSQRG